MAAPIAVVLLVGVIAGLAYSTTAVGYGTLVILPLIVMGIPPHAAVGAALVSVTAVSLVSGLLHSRGARPRMRVLVPLAAGGAVGSFAGSYASFSYLPEEALTSGIAVLALLGGLAYLVNARLSAAPLALGEQALPWLVLGAGFLGGLSTGALGIGWAYITVPALLIFGVGTEELLGSSLIARTLQSGSGAVNYLRALPADALPVIIALSLGGAAASFAGVRISRRMRPAWLRTVIMAWVMLLASWLLVRSVGII